MKRMKREVNTKNHIVPVNTLVVSEDMNIGDLYGINQNGEVVKADAKKGIKAIGIVDKTTILSKGDYICKNREDDILLKGEYIDVVDTCLVIVEDFKHNPNYAIYDYVFLGEDGNMTLEHPNPTESEVQIVGLLVNPAMGVVLVRLLEYMHIVTVKPEDPIWEVTTSNTLCDIDVKQPSAHRGQWVVSVTPHSTADEETQNVSVTINGKDVPFTITEDYTVRFFIQEDGEVNISVGFSLFVTPQWDVTESFVRCTGVVTKPRRHRENWVVEVTPTSEALLGTMAVSVKLNGSPLNITRYGNVIRFIASEDGDVDISVTFEERPTPPVWTVTETTYLCDLVVTEPQDYETAWHVRINPHASADSFSRSVSVRFNGSIIQHTMINAQSYSFITPTDGAVTLSTTYEPNWYLEPPTYTLCSGTVSQPKRFEDDWVVTIIPNEVADLDSVSIDLKVGGTPITDYTFVGNVLRFKVNTAETITLGVTYTEKIITPIWEVTEVVNSCYLTVNKPTTHEGDWVINFTPDENGNDIEGASIFVDVSDFGSDEYDILVDERGYMGNSYTFKVPKDGNVYISVSYEQKPRWTVTKSESNASIEINTPNTLVEPIVVNILSVNEGYSLKASDLVVLLDDVPMESSSITIISDTSMSFYCYNAFRRIHVEATAVQVVDPPSGDGTWIGVQRDETNSSSSLTFISDYGSTLSTQDNIDIITAKTPDVPSDKNTSSLDIDDVLNYVEEK